MWRIATFFEVTGALQQPANEAAIQVVKLAVVEFLSLYHEIFPLHQKLRDAPPPSKKKRNDEGWFLTSEFELELSSIGAMSSPDQVQERCESLFDSLPVSAIANLRRRFAVPEQRGRFLEQFFIDGFDKFLDKLPLEKLHSLVVAPSLLSQAPRQAVNEFLVALIFPLTDAGDEKKDWLWAMHLKHNAVKVDENETSPVPSQNGAEQREEQEQPAANCSGDGGEEESDEIFLSEATIGRYMLEKPELIPREIIVARRKALSNSDITLREVVLHYTVQELKSFAKEKGFMGKGKPQPPSMKKEVLAKFILESQGFAVESTSSNEEQEDSKKE